MGRVLIVDDDPEIVRFLVMLLDIEGFATEQATRGEDAITACAAQAPDAVLVDVAMPGLDGLELCRTLRARGIGCPILVVSARPAPDLPQRARAAGADEFVRKPFDNADLVGRLRRWIATGRGG